MPHILVRMCPAICERSSSISLREFQVGRCRGRQPIILHAFSPAWHIIAARPGLYAFYETQALAFEDSHFSDTYNVEFSFVEMLTTIF